MTDDLAVDVPIVIVFTEAVVFLDIGDLAAPIFLGCIHILRLRVI